MIYIYNCFVCTINLKCSIPSDKRDPGIPDYPAGLLCSHAGPSFHIDVKVVKCQSVRI